MKEIKLTQGKVALVDAEDYEWLNQWKWYAAKHRYTFYAVRMEWLGINKRRTIKMHRFILGVTDTKILIDHQDTNGLNNQRNNIRIATTSQNNCNTKSYKNSSSKYKGVTFRRFIINGKNYDYWIARIRKNYKLHQIGSFKKEEDAAIAYNKKAIELHGEFARLNKIAI